MGLFLGQFSAAGPIFAGIVTSVGRQGAEMAILDSGNQSLIAGGPILFLENNGKNK
ncbi:MAG TPA: hypothetical protein VLD60_00805 [Nitrospira sp.]|nr:hypothetical protein [Nitrospira sp.]